MTFVVINNVQVEKDSFSSNENGSPSHMGFFYF
jgi:hypothetical protein